MKLKFRVVSVMLQELRDGQRVANVRALPSRDEDNRVLWDLPPAGAIELHGIIPRNADVLQVGADLDVTIEEAG